MIAFIRKLLGFDRCKCGEYMGYTPGGNSMHLRCLPKDDPVRIAAEKSIDELVDSLFESTKEETK